MLITTENLAARLDDPTLVIFDCRHDLTDHARGLQHYRAGHIRGAFFAPVESVLAGPKNGSNGRHPLPAPEVFAAFLVSHGVTPQTMIVAYDDAGGLYAARLWWMARWIGHERVVLLDGGLPKWSAEGRETTTAVPAPTAVAPWPARADASMVWTVNDVVRQLSDPSCVVIDARAAERFRGEVEPIDPVAGHIPGALNRFYKQNLRADLTFRPAAELKAEFQNLVGSREAQNVGHQCGSGITACANIFAMEYAGLAGSKLYAGSWSEWVADRSRPVATGPS